MHLHRRLVLGLAAAAALAGLAACGGGEESARPAGQAPGTSGEAARPESARTETAAAKQAEPRAVQKGEKAVVMLYTNKGEIEIELDGERAPVSVENFLAYVDAGHYDGTIFHRVIPGFMIQGGGFTPQMRQKPTRDPIQNEASNGLRNERGTIAMARTNDPNSATAQFFINLTDNTSLNPSPRNPGYAVFGRVVSGMEVVDAIAQVPTESRGPHQNVPADPIVINKAERTE